MEERLVGCVEGPAGTPWAPGAQLTVDTWITPDNSHLRRKRSLLGANHFARSVAGIEEEWHMVNTLMEQAANEFSVAWPTDADVAAALLAVPTPQVSPAVMGRRGGPTPDGLPWLQPRGGDPAPGGHTTAAGTQ
jgi:hypothetical protein